MDKDWNSEMTDYVATVMRTITGTMQAHLRWELVSGTPRFFLLATEWFDKGDIKEPEPITIRNMNELVRAVRDVGEVHGPALFVARNRGLTVSQAVHDKLKTDATSERHFRLAPEYRR